VRAYNLSFISNEDFYNHVKETVEKYRFTIALDSFNQNLIDPIKLTFDSLIYKKNLEAVVESEIIRQIDKSNTNHIGYFNQNIFKYIGDGWSVPATGYDIVNVDKSIYVEIKNKHNTMNSSSSQKTFMRMQSTILKNPKATCMLVEVIARESQHKIWEVSLDSIHTSDPRILRVSIDKFYELVTGEKYAFKYVCEQIPKVIEDVLEDVVLDEKNNSVFEELNKISPNLLKSIYLLSFEKYQGFSNLNVE